MDKTTQKATMLAKLPVNAMEIRTDREKQVYYRKQVIYLIIDAFLMLLLISVMIATKNFKCKNTPNC